MGKKLSDAGGSVDFPATANIKEANARIVGVLGEMRTMESGYEKPYVIYKMVVKEADCTFRKDKQEYAPAEGETIELFAPTRLQRQLKQVQAGQTVSIKYLGTKKNSNGKGMPGHTFEVEVL